MKRSALTTGAVCAVLLAISGAAAVPAFAVLWIDNGRWIHQHTRTFYVYRNPGNDQLYWDSLSGLAELQWDQQTILSLPYTSCHNCARVHVDAGDYGDTGWLGLTDASYNNFDQWAPPDANGHYSMAHVHYNWHTAETAVWGDHVMCHEIGHSLGLGHGGNGCMNVSSITWYAAQGPGGSDTSELNYQYPATGH